MTKPKASLQVDTTVSSAPSSTIRGSNLSMETESSEAARALALLRDGIRVRVVPKESEEQAFLANPPTMNDLRAIMLNTEGLKNVDIWLVQEIDPKLATEAEKSKAVRKSVLVASENSSHASLKESIAVYGRQRRVTFVEAAMLMVNDRIQSSDAMSALDCSLCHIWLSEILTMAPGQITYEDPSTAYQAVCLHESLCRFVHRETAYIPDNLKLTGCVAYKDATIHDSRHAAVTELTKCMVPSSAVITPQLIQRAMDRMNEPMILRIIDAGADLTKTRLPGPNQDPWPLHLIRAAAGNPSVNDPAAARMLKAMDIAGVNIRAQNRYGLSAVNCATSTFGTFQSELMNLLSSMNLVARVDESAMPEEDQDSALLYTADDSALI